MRLKSYFLPTLKEDPAEAQIVSHRLMLRAGMIRQSSAGIYSWLPLGYRVLRRIERIARTPLRRSSRSTKIVSVASAAFPTTGMSRTPW